MVGNLCIEFNPFFLNDDYKRLIPIIKIFTPVNFPVSFMLFIFHFILLLKYIGGVYEKEKSALIFLNDIIRDSEQFNRKKREALYLFIL